MVALNLTTRSAVIGVLDSLGGTWPNVLRNIRAYLYEEQRAVNGTEEFAVDIVSFRTPRQPNFDDCGVFLLAFAANLFSRCNIMILKMLNNSLF